MRNLKTIEGKVKAILEKDEEARNDDMLLYLKVCNTCLKDTGAMPFAEVMLQYRYLGLPSIESVGRTRRKLQAKFPELVGSVRVQKLRAAGEKAYRKDYRKENLLSLSGVYQPKKEIQDSKVPIALTTFLKVNPHIKTIILHLDNDKTGRLCTAALKELLKKDYEIVDDPPPVGKDFNDFLLSYLGMEQRKPSRERGDVR